MNFGEETVRTMFENVSRAPADPILALLNSCSADSRPDKIDLGLGVYRNELGCSPVLQCVKSAEMTLAEEQQTKSYLGPEGNLRFLEGLATVIFGRDGFDRNRCLAVQTPGGSGALRLAGELLAMLAVPTTVIVGLPTWTNHVPILESAGLTVRSYSYFGVDRQELNWNEMLATLEQAHRGDVALLQGCCHNPTGADLSTEQWQEITAVIVTKGLIPLLDIAYHGFGEDLAVDVAGVRHLLSRVEEAAVAYSCSKNFGLYRERVGALFVFARNREERERVEGQVCRLARSNWSMPPDHGAAVVSIILESASLNRMWKQELQEMRIRLTEIRRSLANAHDQMAFLACQKGLFSQLPIGESGSAWLRSEGIYIPSTGRLNVAGLKSKDVDRLVTALLHCICPERSYQGITP